MNNCISGVVTRSQIKCNEKPYFINIDGHISFRKHDCVALFLGESFSLETRNELVKTLNTAFQWGFEQDRFELK